MIYFVSRQQLMFEDPRFNCIDLQKARRLFDDTKILQVDSETNGLNPFLKDLWTFQIGSDKLDIRLVIDCTTINIREFKELLESKMLIGHNLKFDLQFLYKNGIIPRMVYDTMIAEQLLYLGFPPGSISYSLQSCAERYLHIYLDKTVRGQIFSKGPTDPDVIIYGAGDVTHLEKIMRLQVKIAKERNCLMGIQIECEAVPAIAYLEFCGIHLDKDKWLDKVHANENKAKEFEEKLNDFIINLNDGNNPFCYLDPQGNIWSGFADKPTCTMNWNSPSQVIELAKYLGFNTQVKDKKTGGFKDSVIEKSLSVQKGINDEFLTLYFNFKEASKEVSAFGYGHINSINPITGNLHSSWHQIGTASGRMSCGEGRSPDDELALYKKLPKGSCPKVNLQQLPSDEATRSCFTAPNDDYLMVSADYSAEESRLAAEIYNEPVLLEEFLYGSGDAHSVFAKAFFPKELEGIDVKDVKTLRPDLRKKAKGPEFALSFGGGTGPIKSTLQCSEKEAQEIYDNYQQNMKATCEFAKKGAEFVKNNGYVLIDPYSGNRMNWMNWKAWKYDEDLMNQGGHGIFSASDHQEHRKEGAYWERMARNAVTQGTGACIMKTALKRLFDYIVDGGYFNKIKINAAVHDEITCCFPKSIESFPKDLEKIMEESAAVFCHKLPIPAEAAVGDHWIH